MATEAQNLPAPLFRVPYTLRGSTVTSVRNSGEIESEFHYRLCKTKPICWMLK